MEYLTERDHLVRSLADVLCRRRNLELSTAALTEEWVIPALTLVIEQPDSPSLTILNHAFGPPDHPDFRRLLWKCRDEEVQAKFEEIANGTIRRGQFAAADRLIRGVCSSPAFAARCVPTFQLSRFLDASGILIVEGGGNVSDDGQRTVMGAVVLQTIRYIRTRPRPYPPVILVLDEANNANLIGASGYEVRAAAECQKMGLAIHTLVQSLNFPSQEITEGILTNSLRHEWYFAANEAVLRKAAADLGNKDYEADLRQLKPGERFVKDRASVYREYIPLLDDRWGFPGLAKKKAERALAEVLQRPEYRTPQASATRVTNDSVPEMGSSPRVDPEFPPQEPENPNVGI